MEKIPVFVIRAKDGGYVDGYSSGWGWTKNPAQALIFKSKESAAIGLERCLDNERHHTVSEFEIDQWQALPPPPAGCIYVAMPIFNEVISDLLDEHGLEAQAAALREAADPSLAETEFENLLMRRLRAAGLPATIEKVRKLLRLGSC